MEKYGRYRLGDVFRQSEKTLTAFKNAFARESKNPPTKLLVLRDMERDNAFVALRDYAQSFIHRNKPGWKEAGLKITEIYW